LLDPPRREWYDNLSASSEPTAPQPTAPVTGVHSTDPGRVNGLRHARIGSGSHARSRVRTHSAARVAGSRVGRSGVRRFGVRRSGVGRPRVRRSRVGPAAIAAAVVAGPIGLLLGALLLRNAGRDSWHRRCGRMAVAVGAVWTLFAVCAGTPLAMSF
jgi:hypothetical protein